MGPQLDSCGKPDLLVRAALVFDASMGPQLDSCGKAQTPDEIDGAVGASMGPQLDSCGKHGRAPAGRGEGARASMGPQLDSCGKRLAFLLYFVMLSFNGAAT